MAFPTNLTILVETPCISQLSLGASDLITFNPLPHGGRPFWPSLLYMKIPQNVLKVRYRQKIGIPQAGSWACFKIKTVPI